MSDMTAEYLALRTECGLVDGEHELLWVKGPDAVTFLDSLLSQDIEAIAVGGVAQSLLLAPQGKLRATLWVLRGEGEVGVVCNAGYGATVVGDLNRFKIRIDATIDESAAPLLELWGPHAGEVLGGAGLEAPTGWSRSEAVIARCPLGGLDRFFLSGVDVQSLLDAGAVRAGTQPATAVRIEAGEPRMGLDIDEKTIPQEAGLTDDTVSFTKGCFLGQELVARIDSRGRVNRRLRAVQIMANLIPPQGSTISDGDKTLGSLASVGESLVMRAPVGLALLRREAEPGTEVVVSWEGGSTKAIVRALPLDDFAAS